MHRLVYCCRYYAVVHPMKAQYLCTTSQAKKVTILVWLMAVILSLPTAIVYVSVGDISIFQMFLYDIDALDPPPSGEWPHQHSVHLYGQL